MRATRATLRALRARYEVEEQILARTPNHALTIRPIYGAQLAQLAP